MIRLPRQHALFALTFVSVLTATPLLGAQGKAVESTVSGPVAGPVAGTKVTEPYVRMMAREAYFWGWPMANIFNRRQAFKNLSEPGLMVLQVPDFDGRFWVYQVVDLRSDSFAELGNWAPPAVVKMN